MRHLVPVLLILSLLVACKRDEKPVNSGSVTPATRGQAQPQQPAPPTSTGSEVGATMPAYTATLLDGTSFDVAAERGNVVLLNLWATWCGPCRYEIPELQTLHDRYVARKFKVIGVSVDEGGPEAVKEFVAEYKMAYPVVLDPDGKLAGVFNTQVLPTTVLLDRKGTIVWKKLGRIELTDQEMIAAIEKSL